MFLMMMRMMLILENDDDADDEICMLLKVMLIMMIVIITMLMMSRRKRWRRKMMMLMLKLMLMIMVMVKMMIMIMIFEFQASRFWSYTIDTSPVAGEDEAIEVVKAPRFQTTLGDSTATCSKQTCESSLAQRQVTRLHPDDASCLSHHRETLFDSLPSFRPLGCKMQTSSLLCEQAR